MLDILTLGAARKYTDTVGQRIIEQIEEEPIFRFKGVKDLISELPSTDNTVGDIWHVNEDGNEYVWIESDNVGSWEEFGGTFDYSSIQEKEIFVTELPNSNIDETAAYYVLNSKFFPTLSEFLTPEALAVYPFCCVTCVDTIWRLMRADKGELFDWSGGANVNRRYTIYNIVDGAWTVEYPEQTNKNFGTYMGLPNKQSIPTNLYYASGNITTETWSSVYNPSNNRADYKGDATDPTSVDPYQWMKNKYINNEWVEIGVCNFEELFNKANAVINSTLLEKLNKNQGSTNAGKYMQVGNDGELSPQTLDLSGKVDVNQGQANEGKILQVNSSGNLELTELSSSNKKQKFVTSLPQSNIEQDALYYIKNDKLFPDVSSYIGRAATYNENNYTTNYVAVTHDTVTDTWRMVRFDNWADGYSGSWYRMLDPDCVKKPYIIYDLSEDGLSWVSRSEDNLQYDASWGSICFIPYKADIAAHVVYANFSFGGQYDNVHNNQTDQYGTPIIPIDTDTYLTYKYNGTSWDMLGLSNYDALLATTKNRVSALESDKVAIAQGVEKAGKVMQVNSSGDLEAVDLPQSQGRGKMQHFVSTLPNSNIDVDALYYIKYNNIFPDTTSYIGANLTYIDGTVTTPYVAVTYNSSNNVWRMARFDVNEFWYIGEQGGRSRIYQAYEVSADGLSWEPLYEIGQNSNQWINDLNIVQKRYAEDLVIFTNANALTDPANNETDQYGVPLTPTDTDTYLTYHYDGASWEMIGLSSYDVLLATTKSRVTALENNQTVLQQTTGQSTTDGMTQKAITDALSGKLDKPLIFTNLTIAAADWADNATTPDEGFESYAYKATITGLTGITADMLGTVIYTPTQIESGNYAEDCVTGAASITIYSKSDAATTIPTVIVGTPITVVNVNSNTQLHNYSTNEQIIGSWIDGKPLYEKTLYSNTNVGFNSDTELVLNDIIPNNIENIASLEGIINFVTTGNVYYAPTGAWFSWYIEYSEKKIFARQSLASATPISCYTKFTIQYTKTTDIANN